MLIIPPHRIPVPFPLPSLDRVVMAERKSTLSSPSDVSASPSASKCHSLPQVMDSHAPKRPDDAPSVGKDDSIEVEQSPEGTPQTPQGSPQLSTEGADEGDSLSKQSGPVQKRRRVTRACDECRRKKIKCDGNQPCTHCTVYSYGNLPSFPPFRIPSQLIRQTAHIINLQIEGAMPRLSM